MIDFEALGQLLIDAKIKNVTYNTMPQNVSKGVCLRSNISGDKINYEIPGLGRGEFRLFTRATSVRESEALLMKAIDIIAVNGKPKQVGRMRVRYCLPITSPMSFPVSDGNLRESSVTMAICYDFSTDGLSWLNPNQ